MTGWDLVHTHLLTYLPTLPGLTDKDAVSDGPLMSKASLSGIAEVGYDGDTSRGFYEQTDEDFFIAETGEVTVRLTARSGDTDLDPLEDQVEAWVNALKSHFRADKTLGGVLVQSSTVNVGRVDKRCQQTKSGAIVQSAVAVRYFTRVT